MSDPRSPSRHSPIFEDSRRYSADATVLLVGFVGAGKKILGIIASVALRRRFIDFDAAFRQEVQLSPQEYIARHGSARYRESELEVTRSLLERNSTGCVIVGLGWSGNHQQQQLLKDFARNHPVVYIRRGPADLRQFIATSLDTFSRIYAAGNQFFQSCSNFDFFNRRQESTDSVGRPLPAYMKLKETERVFLGFLGRILGRACRVLYSSEPFSPSHTYALQAPLSWLETEPDLEVLESGVDAINLIIDSAAVTAEHAFTDKLVKHMATVRKHTRVPVFVETRSPMQPELLESLLRLAPDVLACPLDSGPFRELNSIKGHTKIIATYQQSTPLSGSQCAELASLLERARSSGFDALRVTAEANVPADSLSCIALQQHMSESNFPVIIYHTGLQGRSSICLNPTLSPVVPPSMQDTGLTLESVQRALVSCYLLPKRKFTVFGQNVANSLSPAMHNAAYTACGLPHVYNIVCSDDFSDIHRLLHSADHGGVAITLPYKSDVLPFLDEISPDVKDIQAVNTVTIEQARPDGAITLKGHNTDYIGIRDCIHKHLSPANAIRPGITALIIGAGGMARAAIYACYQLGVRQICIYNRTIANAQTLADYYSHWADSNTGTRLHIQVLRSSDPWPEHLRQPTIIAACLPAFDMSQSPVSLHIPDAWLQSPTGGVLIDRLSLTKQVAYGHPQTPIRKKINTRSSKWVIVDGLVLLLEQGIIQYELFTKRPAPVHVMRRALEQAINTHPDPCLSTQQHHQ
ncbi:hypothetical protein BO94DRAFT_596337 [Aspergillus sclerotioniger CBS 115572]|uniref:Uncharacterized protein n=1 Tax=Aspergillus sclerotioniger CBS 115572 TaxID=1450535 RepID=A0A317WN31_9EURO|nr:hypothetical protein BO94DRAFT_596337 [Aspergillus sclerotioniger CBS 115572]PWY87131.1 hypothetical protein BO94DRAFT_596337 [Aspergillus sclerotioniger CBS 115572]